MNEFKKPVLAVILIILLLPISTINVNAWAPFPKCIFRRVYDAQDIGYTNQKYAIKMKVIKFYDKPIPREDFVLWNKKSKVSHAPQSRIYVVEREE